MLRPGERTRKDPNLANDIVGRVGELVITEAEVEAISRKVMADLKMGLMQEIANTESRLKENFAKEMGDSEARLKVEIGKK